MNKKASFEDIEQENKFIKNIFNFTIPQENNSADQINKMLSFH